MKRSIIGILVALVLVAGTAGTTAVSHAQAVTPLAATQPDPAAPSVGGNTQDTDQVEEQVGDQNDEAGGQAEANDPAEATIVGSVAVGDPEPADLSALAKITPEQAQAAALAANPGTTVTKTELENADGYLVYGVELSNGTDVKVDAGDGKVLRIEPVDPSESAGAQNANGGSENEGADTESGD